MNLTVFFGPYGTIFWDFRFFILHFGSIRYTTPTGFMIWLNQDFWQVSGPFLTSNREFKSSNNTILLLNNALPQTPGSWGKRDLKNLVVNQYWYLPFIFSGQRWSWGHHWCIGGKPSSMHQTFVCVHQGAQPPKPGSQGLFHPGQEDGKGFRQGHHEKLQYVQVSHRKPF